MATSYNQEQIDKNSQEIENNTNLVQKARVLVDNLPSGGGGGGGSIDWDDAPIASKKQLGVVQIGDGISVTPDGVISVSGGDSIQVMTGEEIIALPSSFTGTVLCTETFDEVKSGTIYIITDGEITGSIALGGGGGGQVVTNTTETISDLEENVAVGAEVTLRYNFITSAVGKGTAKLLVNGVLKSSQIITQGENSFDVTQYIVAGTNYITISTSDTNGSVVNLDYIINGVKLTMTSTFNSSLVYTSDIAFRYTVIGSGTKEIKFFLDDELVGTATVKSSGSELNYTITNLTHGVHKFEAYATTEVSGITITSNILSYKILYAQEGVTTPIISTNFSTTECKQGELLNIDYLVYDPLKSTADVVLQINAETPMNVQVDRTTHYWGVTNYPIGDVEFKISCRDEILVIPVTVEEVHIDIEPVTENLQIFLTAMNRSNAELEEQRKTWKYGDISAQLTGFNWSSNGWMNGALKLTGFAQAYIPFNIFDHDIRITGKTIEIEFETHNVTNLDSNLITCWDGKKGIKITSTECHMVSEQEEVTVKFKENERMRISIVVDDMTTNRLIKTYINGVLSGISQYSLQDNFQQGIPVGITINEDREEIDVYSIRVYDSALTSRDVLNNYICDLTDINEKLIKYQSNDVYDIYGDISLAKLKSMIPILQITGDLPASKGDKKTVSTIYNDPVNPNMNFSYSNCTIDIQGTSSQYFPKKNYKIKFPEKFAFYDGAIKEKTYTFKADYMESSHSHNTGNAIFINSLYDELFPTQTTENGVRNTIYGFPCAIFYRASEDSDYEYFGAYNFNNDKSNSDTLGLVGEGESWEFGNNTSGHCLLRDDNFDEGSGVEDDFEARYPDGFTDYTNLKRVVSWIVSTNGNIEKFKSEFNQYFNMYYCLIYYVMMEFALMIDSRAKNMFFDTADGTIWYPRFYDMDTCYGLNNEGVLQFGYGLEQHDDLGSLKVYNGENSLFWNNFEEAYPEEIQRMYLSLRASGKLSYDSVMAVLKNLQVDKFNEAQYNEDAKFKYINPINESGDTTYLYAGQGTRLAHLQWWVYNRIQYLDSKYETPEFISDFITMRLYTDNGDFDLTPYIDQYLKIKFGSTNVKVRGKSGEAITVPAPLGLKFNDTETIIYGGSNISDLGDVSNKYAGTVDISKAKKLKRLKVGSSEAGYENTNLKQLSLGNNPLLEEIDVTNCPNLKGNLDVSGCIKLSEFLAQGTGLTGITFTDGGDLRVLRLPSTLTSLIIKNNTGIEELTLDSSMNIQTLILKNTNIDAFKMLVTALNVTRIYIYLNKDSNATIRKQYLDYLIDTCGGIDDNMMNMQYPNIQGYLTVKYDKSMTQDEIDEMKTTYAVCFPELQITYVEANDMFTLSYQSIGGSKYNVTVTDTGGEQMVVFPSRENVLEMAEKAYPTRIYENIQAQPKSDSAKIGIKIPTGYNTVQYSLGGCSNLQYVSSSEGAILSGTPSFRGCQNLKEVDLVGGTITGVDFSNCYNLTQISNYVVKDNAVLNLSGLYSLKEVDLQGCTILNANFFNCTNLTIKNQKSFYFTSTSAGAFRNIKPLSYFNVTFHNNIRSVQATYATNYVAEAINLSVYSVNNVMTSFTLSGNYYENVSLGFEMPSNSSLSVYGCPNLKTLSVPNEAINLSNFYSLELYNCKKITNVNFQGDFSGNRIVLQDLNLDLDMTRISLENATSFSFTNVGTLSNLSNINITRSVGAVFNNTYINSNSLNLYIKNSTIDNIGYMFSNTRGKFSLNIIGGNNLIKNCSSLIVNSEINKVTMDSVVMGNIPYFGYSNLEEISFNNCNIVINDSAGSGRYVTDAFSNTKLSNVDGILEFLSNNLTEKYGSLTYNNLFANNPKLHEVNLSKLQKHGRPYYFDRMFLGCELNNICFDDSIDTTISWAPAFIGSKIKNFTAQFSNKSISSLYEVLNRINADNISISGNLGTNSMSVMHLFTAETQENAYRTLSMKNIIAPFNFSGSYSKNFAEITFSNCNLGIDAQNVYAKNKIFDTVVFNTNNVSIKSMGESTNLTINNCPIENLFLFSEGTLQNLKLSNCQNLKRLNGFWGIGNGFNFVAENCNNISTLSYLFYNTTTSYAQTQNILNCFKDLNITEMTNLYRDYKGIKEEEIVDVVFNSPIIENLSYAFCGAKDFNSITISGNNVNDLSHLCSSRK